MQNVLVVLSYWQGGTREQKVGWGMDSNHQSENGLEHSEQ